MADVVNLIITKLRKSRQQTPRMPNRLKTMKVQNEPDQIKELGNNEDAWPMLPGGER